MIKCSYGRKQRAQTKTRRENGFLRKSVKLGAKAAADHHHRKAQEAPDYDLAAADPVGKGAGNQGAEQHAEQGDRRGYCRPLPGVKAQLASRSSEGATAP